MKKTNTILTILAILIWGLFFSLTARAQGSNADLMFSLNQGDKVSKEPYNYILQYWGTETQMHQDNDMAWAQDDEVIRLKGFYNLKELLDWLNDDGIMCFNCDYSVKSVMLYPSKIIQVIDLIRKEEIELEFMKEKKSRPEEVKIEYMEWEDKWYKIKQ